MDIYKEIINLPQFYYWMGDRYMIIGGHSTVEAPASTDRLHFLWEQIKELYEKENLTDDEKKEYAQLVKKMMNFCEAGIVNREELRKKINSLSEREKKDVQWQVEMYKLGREYYREYIF